MRFRSVLLSLFTALWLNRAVFSCYTGTIELTDLLLTFLRNCLITDSH